MSLIKLSKVLLENQI